MAKRIVDTEIRRRPFACSGMAWKLGAIVAGLIVPSLGITAALLAAHVYL